MPRSGFHTQFLQLFRSTATAIRMSLSQQTYTFCLVFIDSYPVYIAESEVVLSIGMALISREFEPLGSLGEALRHTFPRYIERSEEVLSFGMSLVSREFVPLDSFGVALRHTVAILIA